VKLSESMLADPTSAPVTGQLTPSVRYAHHASSGAWIAMVTCVHEPGCGLRSPQGLELRDGAFAGRAAAFLTFARQWRLRKGKGRPYGPVSAGML
jgi:hypothetical protein